MMLTLTMFPAAASVAAASSAGRPPERIDLIQHGPSESCPAPTSTEVVVCRTPDEPFRIPKALRKTEPTASSQSWVSRVATLDEISRVAGGLPDTCSPVGTGGQTGCMAATMRAWAAARRAMAAEQAQAR